MYSIYLLTADIPSLSRIDKDTLPEQALIELLCAGIEPDCDLFDAHGQFKDIERVAGVHGIRKNVQFIAFPYRRLRGSIDTQWMPRKLRGFNIANNFLTGSVLLEGLPETVEYLSFQGNEFTGSLNLTNLPPILIELRVHQNKFSGSVKLDALPETLKTLNISNNALLGSLCLSKFSGSLHELNLSRNKFSGDLLVSRQLKEKITSECNSDLQIICAE